MYPHERSLVSKFENAPFAIVGVNSDRDKEKLAPRLLEERITWRSFWNGEQGTSGPIAKAWNVSGWPTVYVIDHEGIIRHKSHGSPELDEVIETCVERAKVAMKQR